MKARVISGSSCELQEKINKWIENKNPTILKMTQSGNGYQGTDIIVTFLWEES